jgi:hypothetical protein
MAYYEACFTTIPMNQPFSIVPPPELVEQWRTQPEFAKPGLTTGVSMTQSRLRDIATQAAQWGADAELNYCCDELSFWGSKGMAERLRLDRRPRPPSLKEQALASLAELEIPGRCDEPGYESLCNTIRAALEALND